MAPPPSPERAHRQALIKFLEDETLMDWRYFDDLHSPGDAPKGGVLILAKIPDGRWVPGLARKCRLVAQPRLMISGLDEPTVQDDLLDHVRWVDDLLQKLSETGVTGNFANVPLKKALMGIRMTERGVIFDVQRSADNTGDVAVSGRAYMEYEFNIEV